MGEPSASADVAGKAAAPAAWRHARVSTASILQDTHGCAKGVAAVLPHDRGPVMPSALGQVPRGKAHFGFSISLDAAPDLDGPYTRNQWTRSRRTHTHAPHLHPPARTHTHAAGERLVACAGSHVVIGRVTLGHDTLAAIGEAGQTDGEPTKLVQACQPPGRQCLPPTISARRHKIAGAIQIP